MAELMTLGTAQEMYKNLGFDVIRSISSGSFKHVFLANFRGEPIALKVLLLNQVERADMRAHLEFRASREAQVMATINSPYVAKLYDFNRGGLQFEAYLAEEFITGITLLDWQKEAARNHSEIMKVMDDVFQAIRVCADHRVVHRDVKPSNIMLRESGQAVLTDFGLARPIDESTITRIGSRIGTLPYSPPEFIIYRSDDIDQTSDLFSVGIMLYEMLTAGIHPFIRHNAGATEDDTWEKMMLEYQPIPINEVNPAISPKLSKFVMRLIQRERSDRFPSVDHAYSRFLQIYQENQ